MEIQYAGQLTERDLRRALALQMKPSRLALVLRYGVCVLATLAAIVVLVTPNEAGEVTYSAITFPLAVAAFTLSHLWLPFLSAKMQWRNNSPLAVQQSGTITEGSIHFSRATATGTVLWDESNSIGGQQRWSFCGYPSMSSISTRVRSFTMM
jgi:hypothetical protein